LRNFTWIDDPYETPINPEITLGTIDISPADNARDIVNYLVNVDYLRENNNNDH